MAKITPINQINLSRLVIRNHSSRWIFSPRNSHRLNRLRFLTNGGFCSKPSYMLDQLDEHGFYPARYFLAYYQGEIIGWALVNNVSRNKKKRFQIGVYIARPYRKQKVATQLVNTVKKYANSRGYILVATPWNEAGTNLFNATKVKTYHNWIPFPSKPI